MDTELTDSSDSDSEEEKIEDLSSKSEPLTQRRTFIFDKNTLGSENKNNKALAIMGHFINKHLQQLSDTIE